MGLVVELRKFFSINFEIRGYGGFFVDNSVRMEVGNEVGVRERANVGVEVLVRIEIRGDDDGNCIGVLFGCYASPMDILLKIRSIVGVGVANAIPIMVECEPKATKDFISGIWGIKLGELCGACEWKGEV
ncbi:hypothetical protein KC19_VG261600 [Ceratodon purpureus]|uniref:Uncharacterized protein n=1 Tax=Ceratodon purpureus TaxID=3225 RepID=A0A8T0HUL0_CERPU|nr:hypothetical protein KC19_VG261600 [Ceratodon purpureus]